MLGLPQVLVETTGNETIRYVFGQDLLAEQNTAWAYHLNDGLGSVRQLAGEDGQVVLAQSYAPFGEPLWSEGSEATGFGFTGEQWDAEAALLFLRARYYEPGTGRFFTRDPWEGDPIWPSTLHGYSYILNNPVNDGDPSGERSPHILTQIWYAYNYTLIPEYRIPGTAPLWMPKWAIDRGFWWGLKVDLLDPQFFQLYEVEPRWGANSPGHGLEQIGQYISELNKAQAYYYIDWQPGIRATREMKLFWDPINDLHAKLQKPGLIVYWFEPNPEQVKVLVELTCFSALARTISEAGKGLQGIGAARPIPVPSVFPLFFIPPPCFFDPIYQCKPRPVS